MVKKRKKQKEESENKKIKNATKVSLKGINFKSRLEARMYEILVKEGLKPKYEEETFTLWEGFKPTTPFYDRSKKTNKLELMTTKLINITYTPDFILWYKGWKVIIEVKGVENDVFPIKKKLFRKYLEEEKNVLFFELRTLTELKEAIRIIKTYADEDTRTD